MLAGGGWRLLQSALQDLRMGSDCAVGLVNGIGGAWKVGQVHGKDGAVATPVVHFRARSVTISRRRSARRRPRCTPGRRGRAGGSERNLRRRLSAARAGWGSRA
eukprot:scaffold9530_cov104-Isochrysis_galbana.AAC.2